MHTDSKPTGCGGSRTVRLASALAVVLTLTFMPVASATAASLDDDDAPSNAQTQKGEQNATNEPGQPEYRADELIQNFDPLGPTGSIDGGSVIPPMFDDTDQEQPALFGD